MIVLTKKDITTADEGIIAHGVNCQHAMGSGVALAIKTKWPVVYNRFMYTDSGKGMLGTADIVEVENTFQPLYVANCYTQEFFGRDGVIYADITAIEQSLTSVFEFANKNDIDVYLPKIGCGLGGLSWEGEVSPIIKRLDTIYNQNNNTFICEWE